ncbi:MAG: hypothetical protein J5850_03175, partial [Clostridia bacterium]|nr:hypothetical protein [Clostridia bacterium]
IPSEVTKGLPVTFGPTQSGGASLKWFAEDVLGTDIHSAEFLAEKTDKGSDGMIFLPYISGERSPIWNPNATGSFHYIKSTTKAGSFVRSVMEGVAFSIRHVLEVCSPDRKAEKIRISGGGAKSDLWAQIKSDVNGVPVELLKCQDASSLGAAITASICSGIYSDISEATKKMVHTDKIIYPDENSAETYDLLYEKYLEESKRASEN